MSQINPKEKYSEIMKELDNLNDEDVLSEFKHHKLLRELHSIGVKSEAITELEMLIHYYGNKQKELIASARKLIEMSSNKLNHFYNITSVLTGFFEIDLVIDYLEEITLFSGNQSNGLVTSNAILFYFINGNLDRAKEKFGAFFDQNDHARFERLSALLISEKLSVNDLNKIKDVVAETIREKNLRIIAIDHSYVEHENLFDIRIPTDIEKTFELNDYLFDKLYDLGLLRVQNALTYSFCPSRM